MPLYTIWSAARPSEILFAVLHCTGGDVLIAGASLLLALLLVNNPAWPGETYGRVGALTVAFGIVYTTFSEWLNIEVRGSWAYSDLMPVIPMLDAGLSPLAQWIVIPLAALWWARRPLLASVPSTEGQDVQIMPCSSLPRLSRGSADPKKGDAPMRTLLTLLVMAAALSVPAVAGEPRTATLYKNPQCGCCEGYADYLRDNGFEVTVKPTHDLPLLRRQYGVPEPLAGCHTTLVDGYVVEGHVPIGALLRMLTERPTIKGISLPGMPAGSPGMFGEKTEPFTIYEIGDGEPKVYAVE